MYPLCVKIQRGGSCIPQMPKDAFSSPTQILWLDWPKHELGG